ncbi:MAG: hypothetical protein JSW59_04125 [Phycisphaerales bacterium]|nr:MAG: hypothetical protein JSW59_04125 [Phycisphaerales bacterium]
MNTTVNAIDCKDWAMSHVRRRVIRGTVFRLFPVFSVIALVVMLCESATGQRPGSKRPEINPKVKVGELAPDFELPRLVLKTDASGKNIGVISDDDTVRLSSFRGKKPVCLIMSSYT